MSVLCDCACGSVYVAEDGLDGLSVKEQNIVSFPDVSGIRFCFLGN